MVMSKKKVDLTLENVTIESVAAEGKALARVDGMVVFVDFAVPGRYRRYPGVQGKRRTTWKVSSHGWSNLLRNGKKPSASISAFAAGAGGSRCLMKCNWNRKDSRSTTKLVRIGHLDVPEIRPTLPSERTRHYRNKLEFTASARRWLLRGEDPESIPENDRMGLGFHVGKFFDKVLDIQNAICSGIRRIPSACLSRSSALITAMNSSISGRTTAFSETCSSGRRKRATSMLIVCFARGRPETGSPAGRRLGGFSRNHLAVLCHQ